MSKCISPRMFKNGKETNLREAPDFFDEDAANVLIVCGQGVYADGRYYSEFEDRDVYLEHALTFQDIAAKFKYNFVVASGGFTQKDAPWVSEAESFIRILEEAPARWPKVPIVLDEAALDSAENLLLGLMTARLVLGSKPIRRVGIWAAWKFKKWRFNRNAEALGIIEKTYFHGLSPAAATNIQVPPQLAEQPTSSQYKEEIIEYGLLRRPEYEAKRQNRWQNNRADAAREIAPNAIPDGDEAKPWERSVRGDRMPIMLRYGKVYSKYSNRLAMFGDFEDTWKAIGSVAEGKSPKETELKEQFAKEVMM